MGYLGILLGGFGGLLGCFWTSNLHPEAPWGPLGEGAEKLKALLEGPRGAGAFPDRAPEGSLKFILNIPSVQNVEKWAP